MTVDRPPQRRHQPASPQARAGTTVQRHHHGGPTAPCASQADHPHDGRSPTTRRAPRWTRPATGRLDGTFTATSAGSYKVYARLRRRRPSGLMPAGPAATQCTTTPTCTAADRRPRRRSAPSRWPRTPPRPRSRRKAQGQAHRHGHRQGQVEVRPRGHRQGHVLAQEGQQDRQGLQGQAEQEGRRERSARSSPPASTRSPRSTRVTRTSRARPARVPSRSSDPNAAPSSSTQRPRRLVRRGRSPCPDRCSNGASTVTVSL